MKSYLKLLSDVLMSGVQKPSGRENMPDVLGLTHGTIEMDLRDGFPLLTTKKMFYRGIVEELLWFLRGETNIKTLVDKGCNFWNKDAYGYYLKQCKIQPADNIVRDFKGEPVTFERFVELIKTHDKLQFSEYALGDLGPVYGHQWRDQNGVDQLKDVYDTLISNPYGRYKIIDAWNKKDFPAMALPPCHILYQFLVEPISVIKRLEMLETLLGYELQPEDIMDEYFEKYDIPKFYLDLNMYQRSCDMVLGVPFNIASMAFFLSIMAKATKMIPRTCFWIGGHCDIYMEHIPAVGEQLSRPVRTLPKLTIAKNINSFEEIFALEFKDFEITAYDPHPKIEAELFTGLAK